jgi:hypothetical protein
MQDIPVTIHNVISSAGSALIACRFDCLTENDKLHRAVEDYAVVYVGSPLFKILRLLIIAIFSIHLFACIFYRVKEISAFSQDDVTTFYVSRNAGEDVSYFTLSLF